MIAYTMLGTNDFDRAVIFYDKLLGALGAHRVLEFDGAIGWATGQGPIFCVTRPADGRPACIGNGSMIALGAESPERVDQLHTLALSLGATDEGEPRRRQRDSLHYHAGYVRDPDGNKLNFFCMVPAPEPATA
jgi:catechol 2,3-dioxygenase-like lactoylglutathione lyase family enzyme